MTRIHPDDIRAIAQQVAAMLLPSPVNVVSAELSGVEQFQLRTMARNDLAAAQLKKQLRKDKRSQQL